MFNLSWVQRLTLFVMCFSAGAVMIGLSFMFLPMILLKPHKFAAAFTAGNLLAIMRYVVSSCQTGFLLFLLWSTAFCCPLRHLPELSHSSSLGTDLSLSCSFVSRCWAAMFGFWRRAPG